MKFLILSRWGSRVTSIVRIDCYHSSPSVTRSHDNSKKRVQAESDGSTKRIEKYAAYFEEEEKLKAIKLDQSNWSVKFLAEMLVSKDLNVNPEYQRGFVWKKESSARLIETILGRRFIPPIVLHQQDDETYDVIDGKQRISTILAFYFGAEKAGAYNLPLLATSLEPENLDEGEQHPLKGLKFIDLPDSRKKAFANFNIDVKIVPKGSDDDLVFDIYEDINSGSHPHSLQQLRRSAYRGAYMNLVNELREDDNLKHIRGTIDEKSSDDKELDGEMVLRGFAFSNCKLSEYKGPLKNFLNREAKLMKKVIEEDKDDFRIIQLGTEFRKITFTMVKIFGPREACREWSFEKKSMVYEWKKDFSLWLWDGLYNVLKELMCDTNEVTSITLQRNASKIVLNLQKKFEDGAFDKAKKMIKGDMRRRHDILSEIIMTANEVGVSDCTEVVSVKRNFDRKITKILWEKQGGNCPACEQIIHEKMLCEGSYTHIDHIIPYSKGGKTEQDNAQLLHATCNMSKGARME